MPDSKAERLERLEVCRKAAEEKLAAAHRDVEFWLAQVEHWVQAEAALADDT